MLLFPQDGAIFQEILHTFPMNLWCTQNLGVLWGEKSFSDLVCVMNLGQ